jgi:signal transduction histidine kinase/DNA-binding response OmpR family regulator
MTARFRDSFDADSEVAHDLRLVDWAATPLGPPASWPQSLQTVVRTVLTSRFSMWMAWGPDLTFFCNDAYRRDTLGKKYPWALGRPAQEVWAEIWPEIGPRIDSVLDTGTATWDEALLLFLERSGYAEETYHTFSYSPLADEAGAVVGILCVVTEDTERVIAQQRMSVLRELGIESSMASALRSEPEYFDMVCQQLDRHSGLLPFTLIYVYDEEGDPPVARLVCSSGIPVGHPAAPAAVYPYNGSVWPAADLLGGVPTVVSGLPDRFPDLPTGAWEEPPRQALLVPIPQQGQNRPYGFLVVAINRYRPVDEGYRGFVDLLAGQLAAGVASARAYQAERRRADALTELDRAKTAFFTNISHEFRTPLTLLLGPAEDALADTDEPLPAQQRDRLEIIDRNGQRLLRLVNALLDFSRIESGRLVATYEPLDLAQETANLASTFRSAIERVDLTLTVHTAPLSEPVLVDREMWAKIVLNLLSNALKFTFDGGIEVTVREIDGFAEVSVSDTGTGIAEEEQAHLFERFHRIAGVKSRSHEGSGIGLALVAELVREHGGTVSVRSTPGIGSTFTVRLRFGSEHLPAERVGPHASGAAVGDRTALGFLAEAERWLEQVSVATATSDDDLPRVLVVDDNADMREYLSRLLADSYRVTTAVDGVEAQERALADPPDLVLTDVMMPRLDGFGLLEALRNHPRTEHIPIVMLSARAGEDSTVEGLEAGADDYLIKPFTARELLARVRANLELDRIRRQRLQVERSQALLDHTQRLAGVGSWEIDLDTQRARASAEFVRQLQLDHEEMELSEFAELMAARLHPHDRETVQSKAVDSMRTGTPLNVEARLVLPDGQDRIFHVVAEVQRDGSGRPVRLAGSNQDITEQRQAEAALADAAAAQVAAQREHRIADELQRSLLPAASYSPDHLQVAAYYRAGVEGTHVGGDWYDVIELGAGRTALVLGDVMGRGVRAAAVMGQLRAAVRAYARLDLPPADVLEFMDGVVRELGEDQIVTCVYAVYDPGDGMLSYANAGHLPPLLATPDGRVRRLEGAAGPPLGTGLLALTEKRVALPTGSTVVLYTDGLVEHRGTDIDSGISHLEEQLTVALADDGVSLDDLPATLVARLRSDEPDDDIALLFARAISAPDETMSAALDVIGNETVVRSSRHFVADRLSAWQVPHLVQDEVVLLVSELVTNAVIHGRAPIQLRMRKSSDSLVVEVRDSALHLPRRLRPTYDDEHGRGLQLVSLLADRWGTRPTPEGKSVWCVFSLTGS